MKRKSDGAREILNSNLRALMAAHPILKDRKAIKARTGVSPRTIGYMLQPEVGNPTLANLEAVATAFHLDVWELLMPGLDISNVQMKAPEREIKLQKQIEAAMAKLGVTEYKVKEQAKVKT